VWGADVVLIGGALSTLDHGASTCRVFVQVETHLAELSTRVVDLVMALCVHDLDTVMAAQSINLSTGMCCAIVDHLVCLMQLNSVCFACVGDYVW
jgi:hypothetical protein